ncbi:DUF4097 family beta strand repeat-containing protein [Ornithinibacillus bavariensis]|uniref:DUF4097 domain-containing protein n=1 Tax=Ornithinibacillus bavariensis TaxID=545502 RepID=A0A920C7L2_9BACI|nr:DUF4097 family beta strand repeat-containing protein [Ornithinibacillus bavariensis]GIO27309.1 hypothetical protein J43TS3_19200 [Ornithinibacillus bavariensis]
MPKQKLLIVIASCLLAVGLVGVLATFRLSGSAEEISKKEVIENTNITDISIEADNAGIEVLPTKEETITVEFYATESKQKKYNLELEEQGQSLAIELEEKVIQFLHFGWDFDFKSPKLTVYLPEKMYHKLKIEAENGKIEAENVSAEDVAIETENGRVELTEVITNRTHVTSENGSIRFNYVDGQVSSDVTNGTITFITDDLDRSIDLESVNGRIKVQTQNEPTNATIDASVVNGKVDIFGSNTRSSVTGNGENRIKLTTVNGSITVSK